MPNVQTRFFGDLEYESEALFRFPSGLPGFEDRRNFVFLKKPGLEPMMFLQSLDTRSLCFILLPVRAIDENFQLELTHDEVREIGLPAGRTPVIGEDILCAALICASEGICAGEGDVPTANLMAPVVVNLHNNIGMQVIRAESSYSHRHPVLPAEAHSPC
jgi:flagellar assembly factor FliW